MTDRELLELAAKAAGYLICGPIRNGEFRVCQSEDQISFAWNPLIDDGDALRLAVKLRLAVMRCYLGTTVAQIGTPGLKNAYEEATDHKDPASATRLAIVRAAAEIGRRMK